jgi:nicotinamidase-related amidase
MRILKENTFALIIDIQEKLFPYIADNKQFMESSVKLIEGLKILDIPIIISEQYKKGLGETIKEISSVVTPIASFEKTAFSCCDEPEFMKLAKWTDKKNAIICGIESHICVLQTSIDLITNGYNPIVIADCVSSRKLIDKQFAIERLIQEGAMVSTYESILFELCRYAGTERFKAISKLIK